MDALFDLLPDADDPILIVSLLVFLAAASLALGVMATMRVRGAVKRRAAEVATDAKDTGGDKRSLRYASRKAAARVIEYTTRHYSGGGDDGNKKQLRQRLLQAGFLDSRAPAFFFLARVALAIVCAIVAFAVLPMVVPNGESMAW